jgi:hypothetical protein
MDNIMNAEDYRELDMRVAELEDEVKRLKHALNAIAFPIKHMTEEAEAQGHCEGSIERQVRLIFAPNDFIMR